MQKIVLVMLSPMVATLAGCGNFGWFPSSSSSGTYPSPPPPGGILTDLQANTVTQFLPYTVAFSNITSSATTTSISVSGDASSMYAVNGGTPTNTAGIVKAGDAVTVQNTTSNYGSNISVSTLLNIGGANATYTSSTGNLIFLTKLSAPLTTPNFASDQTAIPLVFQAALRSRPRFVWMRQRQLPAVTAACGSTATFRPMVLRLIPA